MQINATNNLPPLTSPAHRVAAPSTDRRDAAVFSHSEALNQKLALTPEVRPEYVARARDLVANTSYPPDVTIRGIANLLASKFTEEGE